MANLFQIEEEYFSLLREIEELDGEVTPELESALEINKENLEAKLIAYNKFIRFKQGEIKILEDEISVYKSKVQSREKLIERIKLLMKTAVNIFGEQSKTGTGKRLKIPGFSLWTVYHKPLVIEDEFGFKDEMFIRHKATLTLDQEALDKFKKHYPDILTTKEIDRRGLQNYLKEGNEVEGATLDLEANYLSSR